MSKKILTGQNNGLRVTGLGLLSHGFLDDLVELRCQRYGPGTRQGQRITDVRVRVDADKNRSHVRLEQKIKKYSTEKKYHLLSRTSCNYYSKMIMTMIPRNDNDNNTDNNCHSKTTLTMTIL